MIDFRDPFKPDLKASIKPKNNNINNSSSKLSSYQNNHSQVERIYINKSVAMGNIQKGSSRNGKKASSSEAYRRGNVPNDVFQATNFDLSKTLMLNFPNGSKNDLGMDIRREPDVYKNNQHSLMTMVKKYKEKERRWEIERLAMRSDMQCLQEELNAIRSFILNEKTIADQVDDLTSYQPPPVPAFIKA